MPAHPKPLVTPFTALPLLALVGCQLGDLVSPPDAGRLQVVPAALDQTLVAGMGDVVSVELRVTTPDQDPLRWTARVENGDPWLELGVAGGRTPGTLSLTLDPGAEQPADVEAAVVLEAPDELVAPERVPVRLHLASTAGATGVAGCVVLTLVPGSTVAGWVRDDCRATAWGHVHYARIFRFEGQADDVVTISASSPDFGAIFPMFGPGDWPGGPILQEVNACPGTTDGSQSCLVDFRLPESGAYTIEVTPWQHGLTGRFTLTIGGGG